MEFIFKLSHHEASDLVSTVGVCGCCLREDTHRHFGWVRLPSGINLKFPFIFIRFFN